MPSDKRTLWTVPSARKESFLGTFVKKLPAKNIGQKFGASTSKNQNVLKLLRKRIFSW